MATTTFDLLQPPDGFTAPGELRPRSAVAWTGGVGPFDITYEWDTAATFDTGNLITVTTTGATGTTDTAVPTADIDPATAATWYHRATITDTNDAASSTSPTITIAPTDPATDARYLHLQHNIGFPFAPDTAARYLHLQHNIGFPFAPDDQARYLHLQHNVTTDIPCPYITGTDETIAVATQPLTLRGYDFTDPPNDTGPEVRAYHGPDTTDPYTVIPTAGLWTEEAVTVTPPSALPDPVWLRIAHTGTQPAPCGISNAAFIHTTDLAAPDPDPTAGWWIEAWDLANANAIVRGIPAIDPSIQAPLNDIGDGSITIRADYDRIRELCDPPNGTATLIKVYADNRYRYAFFADQITDPGTGDPNGLVTISGRGIEAVLSHARLYPRDYNPATPSAPTVAPDWNFGYEVVWYNGLEDTADPAPVAWDSRNGGYADGAGNIVPNGVHSGIQKTIPVTPGATLTFETVINGATPGQRITNAIALGTDPTSIDSTESFLYNGEVLTELGNAARNPAHNGCPGGATDGTDQTTTTTVTVPAGVTTATIIIQSDHHGTCGGPGNIPFALKSATVTYIGGGVPDGWTSSNALTFATADTNPRTGSRHLVLVGDTTAATTHARIPITVAAGAANTILAYGDHSALAGARLEIWDAAGATKIAEGAWVPGNYGTYTEHRLDFTAAPDTTDYQLRIVYAAGQGPVIGTWDDITVVTGTAPTSPGGIIIPMIQAAQARGTITALTWDFTDTYDSDGNLWTNTAIAYNFGHGQTIAEVLGQIASMGYEWTVTPRYADAGGDTGLLLRLYNSRAASPTYGVGTHHQLNSIDKQAAVLDGQIRPADQTTQQIQPTVIYGEGAAGTAGTIAAEDLTDAAATIGRREAFYSNDKILDQSALTAANDTQLENYAAAAIAATVEILEASPYRPFLDFGIGDTIYADLGDRLPAGWYRVARIAAAGAGDTLRYIIDLGKTITPPAAATEVTLAKLIAAAGTTVGGAPGTAPAGSDTGAGTVGITIGGSAPLPHTHPITDITPAGVAGDLAGSLPNPTVARIQGRDWSNTAPTDGQVPSWDDDLKLWTPADPSATTDLDALTDTDLTTTPPADGDHLEYDAVGGLWIPAAPPTGGGGGGGGALDDLTDVTIATPTDGQALTYTVGGGTDYPYGSTPANDGIIDALGGQAAHGVTLNATQSSTNAGLVADNALSPAIDTASGRSHTTNETAPWWKVELIAAAAEIELEAIALRAQNYTDGIQAVPLTVEARRHSDGTWITIGTITTNPGNSNWTAAVTAPAATFIDAIRITGTSNYLVIGSVEIWGTYYPSGATTGWVNTALPGGSVLLAETVLAADAANIAFTGIPAGYDKLLITGYLRSDRSQTGEGLGIRFGAASLDAGSNYAFTGRRHGNNAAGINYVNYTRIDTGAGALFGANAAGGRYGWFEVEIPDYADATYMRRCWIRAGGYRLTDNSGIQGVGTWENQADPIQQILLYPSQGGTVWKAGGRARLYAKNI